MAEPRRGDDVAVIHEWLVPFTVDELVTAEKLSGSDETVARTRWTMVRDALREATGGGRQRGWPAFASLSGHDLDALLPYLEKVSRDAAARVAEFRRRHP